MPTIVFSEDWNSALGGDTTSNATRDTTTTYEGAGSCKLTLSAATGYWIKNSTGSPAIVVMQAYVRFSALPTANCELLTVYTAGAGAHGFGYKQADNKFVLVEGNFLGHTAEGSALATDTWYKLDVKIDGTTNPITVDGKVNDVAFSQVTQAVAGTTWGDYRVGTFNAANTYTMFADKLRVSHTSGDYPITDGASPSYFTLLGIT